jgi:predicted glycosyltransferase
MGHNGMRVLFLINTPGQAYTWRYCIEHLKNHGHEVVLLARNQGPTLGILDSFGFKYVPFRPVNQKLLRPLELAVHLQKGIEANLKNHPDVIVGFGIDASFLGKLINKDSIIFTDSEHVRMQNALIKMTADTIITPDCFIGNLGKRHIRVNGYKELAYLHPNHFTPDPAIFDELKIERGTKYIVVRFNALTAFHDVNRRGFGTEDKYILVKELLKYGRVFISAEGKLPDDLAEYRIPIAPQRIHHALHFAQMFVSDTGTMNTESAVLGTQGVLCFSRPQEFGNFIELEHKYGLVYCFDDPAKAIAKALELIKQPDLKERCSRQRRQLLTDKTDVASFMVDFIEHYPESMKRLYLSSIKT